MVQLSVVALHAICPLSTCAATAVTISAVALVSGSVETPLSAGDGDPLGAVTGCDDAGVIITSDDVIGLATTLIMSIENN